MHHLSQMPRRADGIARHSSGSQDLVRFFALLRIKPHAPLLVRVPVTSFEFHTCVRTPQVGYLSLSLSHSDCSEQLVSIVYGVDYQGI